MTKLILEAVDELMWYILLMAGAAFLLITFPVWVVPYGAYKFWKLKKDLK